VPVALSLEKELETTEREVEVYKEKNNGIVRGSGSAPHIMSAPGAGPGPAAAFPAYAGDGKRFGKALAS
jgi:hypothetical protein